MAKTLTVKQLKEKINDPVYLTNNSFYFLKNLCYLVSLTVEAEQDAELQELLLRTLENKKYFDGYENIVDDLVRKFGLFPYLNPEDLNTKDRIAYEFHRPDNLEDGDIVFHREQIKVYNKIVDGCNVILSAPTSFGKSLIIDAIIARQVYKNILIIVPTIALMDETRRRLSKFNKIYKIITHLNQTKSSKNIFVFTQERAIQYEALYKDFKEINFFIIDEFYKLNITRGTDIDRSIALNQVFYSLINQVNKFYLLGPNIDNISSIPEKFKAEFIKTNYITVASNKYRITNDNLEKKLTEICASINEPTLIYCSSPQSVRKVAKILLKADLCQQKARLHDAVNWLNVEFHPDWLFTQALSRGVGMHHGSLPRSLGHYVVRKFNQGYLNYLICTSTLIEGVNTKAKNIIIYNNKIANKKLDYFTFNNICGRSGRMFEHFIGNIYIFHEPPQMELPYVDFPIFEQTSITPTNLLIHIDETDLKSESKKKIEKLIAQDLLPKEILKLNSSIEPERQIALAKKIYDNKHEYHKILFWSGMPKYKDLKEICKIIWEDLGGSSKRSSAVLSFEQLTFKVSKLAKNNTLPQLIRAELEKTHSADDAVENTISFIRNWLMHHFPRYLQALDNIQRAVFKKLNLPAGDYSVYATKVENLFMDPAVVALEEYGLPLQIAKKIEAKLSPKGELDTALIGLKKLDLSSLKLTDFELDVLRDTIKDI